MRRRTASRFAGWSVRRTWVSGSFAEQTLIIQISGRKYERRTTQTMTHVNLCADIDMKYIWHRKSDTKKARGH
jgi:hypothetical protein